MTATTTDVSKFPIPQLPDWADHGRAGTNVTHKQFCVVARFCFAREQEVMLYDDDDFDVVLAFAETLRHEKTWRFTDMEIRRLGEPANPHAASSIFKGTRVWGRIT